jgi:hypothetical protein
LVEFPDSKTIGNLITKLFHGVKIKPGRCKDNWAKSTKRYYDLSWCKETHDNAIINFNNLASFLPPDFFCYFKYLLKIYKSVDEGSNYYLDKFLAPKNLGLKVGCFTKNWCENKTWSLQG